MREILFRGKRIDNGEWVEGYYGSHSGMEAFIIDRPYISVNNTLEAMNYYEVDPLTVGQYTGLKDKNGKRIFEGDILKRGDCHCIVRYGEFNCSCCDGVYGWYFDDGDIRNVEWYEIIGNIHDNPELKERK